MKFATQSSIPLECKGRMGNLIKQSTAFNFMTSDGPKQAYNCSKGLKYAKDQSDHRDLSMNLRKCSSCLFSATGGICQMPYVDIVALEQPMHPSRVNPFKTYIYIFIYPLKIT